MDKRLLKMLEINADIAYVITINSGVGYQYNSFTKEMSATIKWLADIGMNQTRIFSDGEINQFFLSEEIHRIESYLNPKHDAFKYIEQWNQYIELEELLTLYRSFQNDTNLETVI